MRTAYLTILSLVAIVFILTTTALLASAQSNGNNKVRVIAHTDREVSDALAKGCNVVRETRTLKALICSESVASSLGLQEDIKVFAMDSGANKQIRADLVQSSGNNGTGRKVVVLDTGYNYNHSELSSSYLGGKDFVNDDNDPFDDNGHGSHVAGIITADGVDAKAKGVAPLAGVIAGKVLDSSGSGYFSDVVASIYWAVDGPDGINGTADDFNADAISMSLGTSQPYTYKGFCDNVLPDLTTAIRYSRDRNVIVVVAAGNSGGAGVSIPGCISYSTTVGAVDSKDKIATWSGKGNAVDISAPGINIYSSWLGTSYKTASGTSMATPMVSGTVALVKFAHPEYTVAQIESALFNTAKDLGKAGKDKDYGWGRVDAYGAVNFAS
ncbi:S8 family serine peptidase [Candidatus Woesearchaeota archaeon]|nr:S8 family serine peptidase [Candidatus Woesearchaeota archaeon]